MTINSSYRKCGCDRSPTVKLRAGASIIRVKPLFTYDSKFLIVASGCDIKVFSTSSGECSLIFKGHDHPVVSTQISPQNNLQIISCSEVGQLLRWDYADGKLLKSRQLKFTYGVAHYFAPAESNFHFIATSEHERYKVFFIKQKGRTFSKKTKILSAISPSTNALAFGPQGNYVAGIFDRSLHLYDMKEEKSHKHICGPKLTCVASHPKEFIVATGDVLGRIIVWTGMLDSSQPTRSLYHWHSLPLPYLTFSPEGSHIYSGGGESVLLKVNHSTGMQKKLPRLGLPICCLAVSPDNCCVATAHIDNAVQVISSQYEEIKVIQGLTRGHCQDAEVCKSFAYNMHYDARSKSVIMNGRPGHLQFYDILQDKQLFQLDIVCQNYVCPERDTKVFNTDVVRFALDSNGLWLATVECRNDGETSPEIRLKFWEFNQTTQRFALNTNIFLPHNKLINCLAFQPALSSKLTRDTHVPLAVTTSMDNRFKVWALDGRNTNKSSWSCELLGYYKDLPAGDASFSEDGSLLCVVFDSIATLWIPDTNILKAALSNNSSEKAIKQVVFGRNIYRHLLVGCTDAMLTVWNVLTLSILWNVKTTIDYLIGDPFSGLMAVFTGDRNLFVFEPNEPQPVAVLKEISSVPVISAVFVPSPDAGETNCWHSKSKLFILNENQELLTVEAEQDEEEAFTKLTLPQDRLITPFGFLQAEHSISDIKPIKDIQHILHGADEEGFKQAAELPCPTYVNPIALCEVVLPSLIKASLNNREKKAKDAAAIDVEMDSGVGSEMSTDLSTTKDDVLNEKKKLKPEFQLLEDYSFLLDFMKQSEE